MLGLYVRLKMLFRKGKKGAKEYARKIAEAYKMRTLDDVANFMTRFRYIPDPLWGLLDIQYDLPAFVRRGGGDCDDFALAVCRLAQALGRKAYYITGVHKRPERNHVFAIVRDESTYQYEYRMFTPFVLLPKRYFMIDEAIESALVLGGYTRFDVLDVDEI